MQVILAKTAGFCYGVERAVHMAEAAAREGGCVMLGSIIHNDRVIAALEALGARQADSPQQVRPGETVIIRAHGETREWTLPAHTCCGSTGWWNGQPVRAGHPSLSEKRTIRR